MAFPGTPSTTGAATLGNTVPSWYNRVMLDWLIPELRFYKFADKRPIPQGEGTSVIWNRKVTIHEGYKVSEGYPISAVKTLSTNKVSALLETLADGVVVSEMAYLASVVDTDAYAMEVLAQAAAKTVEKFIIHALVADTVVKHYVKKAGSVISSNTAAVSATASGPRLALSDIRVASTYLQSFNVPTWDGQNYVGIIHPKQMTDLYSDSGFTNWMQYTHPETMFDFEIGRVFNVRLVTSQLVPTSSGSAQGVALSVFTPSSVSNIGYAMTIFGKGAFGVTEIDGHIQTFKNAESSKNDIANLTRAYAYKIAGIAAKVLNPSAMCFIWNGVGDTISAQSTMSERRAAGITCDTDQIPSW